MILLKLIKLDYRSQLNNSDEELTTKKYLYNEDISIGVDIESLESIPKSILEIKNTTLRKLFSEKEVLYSISKTNNLETLTGIFCAKNVLKLYQNLCK